MAKFSDLWPKVSNVNYQHILTYPSQLNNIRIYILQAFKTAQELGFEK